MIRKGGGISQLEQYRGDEGYGGRDDVLGSLKERRVMEGNSYIISGLCILLYFSFVLCTESITSCLYIWGWDAFRINTIALH